MGGGFICSWFFYYFNLLVIGFKSTCFYCFAKAARGRIGFTGSKSWSYSMNLRESGVLMFWLITFYKTAGLRRFSSLLSYLTSS